MSRPGPAIKVALLVVLMTLLTASSSPLCLVEVVEHAGYEEARTLGTITGTGAFGEHMPKQGLLGRLFGRQA